MEKVFLSKKRIYLDGTAQDLPQGKLTPDTVAGWVVKKLVGPLRIIAPDGSVRTVAPQSGFNLKVTAFGGIRTEGGKLATILAVRCSEIIGLFLYTEGDDFLSELVDPDINVPAEIVTGEMV